jgi:hypothetical protein
LSSAALCAAVAMLEGWHEYKLAEGIATANTKGRIRIPRLVVV